MNLDFLDIELSDFVKKQIEDGFFTSEEEVISGALCLLVKWKDYKTRLNYVRREIKKGAESGKSVVFDIEKIKRRVKKNLVSKRKFYEEKDRNTVLCGV